MPLQSRVSPFGDLFADASRGTLMGNRGGRLHNDARTLGSRRWASRQWICCRLSFNDRQRQVWGASYTELFFLDEVTALAAGHRPCFECRRADAEAFANAWSRGQTQTSRARAGEIDDVLHAERLDGRRKRRHARNINTLPDGVMVVRGDEAYAVRGAELLRWTSQGYDTSLPRPDGGSVEVLTPPSILAALKAGYPPSWHPGAERETR